MAADRAAAFIAGWGNVSPPTRARPTQQASATLLSIWDGDTIRVQQGQQRITVRLACIDAPEMAQAPLWRTGPAAICQSR